MLLRALSAASKVSATTTKFVSSCTATYNNQSVKNQTRKHGLDESLNPLVQWNLLLGGGMQLAGGHTTSSILFFSPTQQLNAGHAKWQNVAHRKAKQDGDRQRMFGKISREIRSCARLFGSDPDSNWQLALLLQRARRMNLPRANITKLLSEADASTAESLEYECYGPHGLAMVIKVLTDNKNRTLQKLKLVLSKNGGRMGSPNCVKYMFNKRGALSVNSNGKSEDEVFEFCAEAGAEDMDVGEDGKFSITCPFTETMNIQKALEAKGLTIEEAEIEEISDNPIEVDEEEDLEEIQDLLEKIENLDDVVSVVHNCEM